MTFNRGRSSQVRPRQPSTGRPRPTAPIPRGPSFPRIGTRRLPGAGPGLPLPARIVLVGAICALAGVVLLTAMGILPKVVSTIGSALGDFSSAIFSSASPSPSAAKTLSAPTITTPDRPQTNKASITITGTVPPDVVGQSGYQVLVYVATPGNEPTQSGKANVGQTAAFAVTGVGLEPGRNLVTATIAGPSGVESKPSAAVTYQLDQTKPRITVTKPKNNASVSGGTVTITGKTEALAAVAGRDEANSATATTNADKSGAFTLKIALTTGANAITLTATDLAGNIGTSVLTVRSGTGSLKLDLTASWYHLLKSQLPRSITLTATVTDPNGRPVSGQVVHFTLGVSGLPQVTGDGKTAANGIATFTTRVPSGATVGVGNATALIQVANLGNASDEKSITIKK